MAEEKRVNGRTQMLNRRSVDLIAPISIPHVRSDTASEELETIYSIGDVLGQGAFGIVNLAINKTTKEHFACKIIKKRIGSTSAYEQQEREVAIMKQIDHENILKLFAVYESPSKVALVMELCKGGELVNAIRRKNGCSDSNIRDIIAQLITAVTYLHRNKIIHRDIKPENILLKNDAEGGYILKMADFGLACFEDSANQVDNIAGTLMYMAPEIIAKQWYNHQCDIWSIGVMLYLLLCQYDTEAEHSLRDMIKIKQIEYPPKFWEKIDSRGFNLTKIAKNLCEQILRFDPAMRITAGEIKSHPWFTNSDKEIGGNVIDLMRSYNAERRLRKALLFVLVAVRFRSATKGKTYTHDIEKECSTDVAVPNSRKGTTKAGIGSSKEKNHNGNPKASRNITSIKR